MHPELYYKCEQEKAAGTRSRKQNPKAGKREANECSANHKTSCSQARYTVNHSSEDTTMNHEQAYTNVTAKITDLYNTKQLPIARMDAKYGQCRHSKKFFADPKKALKSMLVNRHDSDTEEVEEMGKEWAEIAEDSIDEYEHSGFVCPVSFETYLLEVAINAMS